MPAGGLNGHQHPAVVRPLTTADKDYLFGRIEGALKDIGLALLTSGFSEYEAGEVTLAARFAILQIVKERARGTGNGR